MQLPTQICGTAVKKPNVDRGENDIRCRPNATEGILAVVAKVVQQNVRNFFQAQLELDIARVVAWQSFGIHASNVACNHKPIK